MTGQTAIVYHYTSTAHLPWIMADLMLKPGANVLGNYPKPEFVWATTDKRGSSTASGGQIGYYLSGYRNGEARLVRFALSATDFIPWSSIGSRYTTWTPEQIARFEHATHCAGEDPADWWCRPDPLPLTRDILIETKAYNSSRWVPWVQQVLVVDPRHDLLGVVIGGADGVTFCSRKLTTERGQQAYAVTKGKLYREFAKTVLGNVKSECERRVIILGAPCEADRAYAMAAPFLDEIAKANEGAS